ncbi:MAG: hypothetical protein K6C10_07015 [Prevotella sp.]|nr:hypothetical protein [Prevotella sp.]
MKKILRKIVGLPMVYVGVAVLLLSFLTRLSRYNSILLLGFLLVLAGTIGYVWKTKRESNY